MWALSLRKVLNLSSVQVLTRTGEILRCNAAPRIRNWIRIRKDNFKIAPPPPPPLNEPVLGGACRNCMQNPQGDDHRLQRKPLPGGTLGPRKLSASPDKHRREIIERQASSSWSVQALAPSESTIDNQPRPPRKETGSSARLESSQVELEDLLKGRRGWDLSELTRPSLEDNKPTSWDNNTGDPPSSEMSGSKGGDEIRGSELVKMDSGLENKKKIRRTKSRAATVEGQREHQSSLRESYEKKKALIPKLVRWNNLCFYTSMLGIVLTITDMELSRHFYKFNPDKVLVPLVLQCTTTVSTGLLIMFL